MKNIRQKRKHEIKAKEVGKAVNIKIWAGQRLSMPQCKPSLMLGETIRVKMKFYHLSVLFQPHIKYIH